MQLIKLSPNQIEYLKSNYKTTITNTQLFQTYCKMSLVCLIKQH